jgi:hypothetical protein
MSPLCGPIWELFHASGWWDCLSNYMRCTSDTWLESSCCVFSTDWNCVCEGSNRSTKTTARCQTHKHCGLGPFIAFPCPKPTARGVPLITYSQWLSFIVCLVNVFRVKVACICSVFNGCPRPFGDYKLFCVDEMRLFLYWRSLCVGSIVTICWWSLTK